MLLHPFIGDSRYATDACLCRLLRVCLRYALTFTCLTTFDHEMPLIVDAASARAALPD